MCIGNMSLTRVLSQKDVPLTSKLLSVCRRVTANAIAADLGCYIRWIQSELNQHTGPPADFSALTRADLAAQWVKDTCPCLLPELMPRSSCSIGNWKRSRAPPLPLSPPQPFAMFGRTNLRKTTLPPSSRNFWCAESLYHGSGGWLSRDFEHPPGSPQRDSQLVGRFVEWFASKLQAVKGKRVNGKWLDDEQHGEDGETFGRKAVRRWLCAAEQYRWQPAKAAVLDTMGSLGSLRYLRGILQCIHRRRHARGACAWRGARAHRLPITMSLVQATESILPVPELGHGERRVRSIPPWQRKLLLSGHPRHGGCAPFDAT